MDEWFIPLIKPGQTVEKHLMRFRLINIKESNLNKHEPRNHNKEIEK